MQLDVSNKPAETVESCQIGGCKFVSDLGWEIAYDTVVSYLWVNALDPPFN